MTNINLHVSVDINRIELERVVHRTSQGEGGKKQGYIMGYGTKAVELCK